LVVVGMDVVVDRVAGLDIGKATVTVCVRVRVRVRESTRDRAY
jgi:hypothetical protein